MEIPSNDLHGQTVLVTGGTSGIGYVTAQALAAQGAQVVIIGRDAAKSARVVEEIRRASHNPQVEALVGDLSSQAELHRLANDFKARYPRLHVLVNNAGAIFSHTIFSADGFEMTLALNYFNYFTLTLLLIEPLLASQPARVINVSSVAHLGASFDLAYFEGQHVYSSWRAYGQSKLGDLLFTYELARRLQGTQVTANAVHPGFVTTNFGRNNNGFLKRLFNLSSFVSISPERGAATSIYLAASPQVAGVSGKYFVRRKSARSSRASYDPAAARQLWQASLAITHLPDLELPTGQA